MRKLVVCLVLLAGVFVFTACPGPATSEVRYEITGTLTGGSETVVIQYTTDSGVNQLMGQSVPWSSATYNFESGASVILQGVFSADSINVTLNIYKDGSVWKTQSLTTTSSGSIQVVGTI